MKREVSLKGFYSTVLNFLIVRRTMEIDYFDRCVGKILSPLVADYQSVERGPTRGRTG